MFYIRSIPVSVYEPSVRIKFEQVNVHLNRKWPISNPQVPCQGSGVTNMATESSDFPHIQEYPSSILESEADYSDVDLCGFPHSL